MTKGITGLDRIELSRLVELVVGDEKIALTPRILTGLTAVRATLMYLRTNASQEAIADVMGASQPTISRTIAVVTRIIARVLGPPDLAHLVSWWMVVRICVRSGGRGSAAVRVCPAMVMVMVW